MRIRLAGVGLIVAGAAIFLFTMASLINGAVLDQQFTVPGTFSAEIDSPGRYYVWDNHWTVLDGKRIKYAADCPQDAKVVVRDASGEELEFVPDATRNWSIGNHEKTSIGYVEVPATTTLQLEIDGVGRERVFTVSKRTMKQELVALLGGLVVGLVVAGVGFLVLLLSLFLPRRDPNAAVNA